jgi:hypothetical protein
VQAVPFPLLAYGTYRSCGPAAAVKARLLLLHSESQSERSRCSPVMLLAPPAGMA